MVSAMQQRVAVKNDELVPARHKHIVARTKHNAAPCLGSVFLLVSLLPLAW